MADPTTVPEPLLRGEELTRGYGGGAAVIDVEEIAVHAGQVLALLGPNGAGKSTLMRLLAALERPDAGRVFYGGRLVGPGDRIYRRDVAAVLQRPYLWRGTVAENVEYGLKVRGVARADRSARARRALERLGIAGLADAPADRLSGGERQRVALARALVLEPRILFLDEPTADLDIAVRRRLLADLESVVRHAAPAVVVITHDAGEAFALADRVAVIESGRIVQTGAPEEVFEAPATEFVASFTGAEFMLSGRVEAAAEGTLAVRLESGHRLETSGAVAPGSAAITAEPGRVVRVAYRPEDVVIGPPAAAATSARNRFGAVVVRCRPHGGLVRVRLDAGGLELVALVTRGAMEELGLAEGARVTAQIKATALHVFAA